MSDTQSPPLTVANLPPAIVSTPIHVRIGQETHNLQLMLSTSGELIGVSNPELLQKWLASRAPRPRNIITAADITETQKRDVRFFGKHPCWFEGCQELRDAYKAELEELKKDPDCKDCEQAVIMRKYFKLVADAQTTKIE